MEVHCKPNLVVLIKSRQEKRVHVQHASSVVGRSFEEMPHFERPNVISFFLLRYEKRIEDNKSTVILVSCAVDLVIHDSWYVLNPKLHRTKRVGTTPYLDFNIAFKSNHKVLLQLHYFQLLKTEISGITGGFPNPQALKL